MIAPAAAADGIDARVQALASAVHDAVASGAVDGLRIYVAGRGDGAASVYYAISRLPDMFAAGVAVGGSPQPAIDTGRVFSANFTNAPVLWVSDGAGDEALAGKLKSGGMNVEWRSSGGIALSALFDWLAGHARQPYPAEADCETNSPAFASCFWLEPTKFDMNERNDVLPSTRILAGAVAALDLGGFGYKPDEAGPGILVSYLPEKYTGPLKMGDRIMEIEGKAIAERAPVPRDHEQVHRGKARGGDGAARQKPRTAGDARGAAAVRCRDHRTCARQVRHGGQAGAGGQPRGNRRCESPMPEAWVGSGLMWNGLSMEKIENRVVLC